MENSDHRIEHSNSKKGEAHRKLELLRVKFLRLAIRLGIQNPNNNLIVSQVLQRLVLLPSSDDDQQLQLQLSLPRGRDPRLLAGAAAFRFDREAAIATEQLAAAGHYDQEEEEEEEAGCTILVLGKTGVGKSATINSIFENEEVECGTDAFQLGTQKVRDVVGIVKGIKLRIIDTPGLVSSSTCSDQHRNEKTLHSIKKFIRKTHPDIVLYVDRLDMPIRRRDDFGDIPLLRTVTKILGSWLWFKAIVVLTHAESAHLDASSYDDTFVTQRSHVVQKSICQAVGRMQIMNPIVLAENNNLSCRKNSGGQRVRVLKPNDEVWVPHLLLLSFASMIMAEANNTLLKLQADATTTGFWLGIRKLFGPGLIARAPPLNFIFSSLFRSIPQMRPQIHEYLNFYPTDYLDNLSDSDGESENYCDELPPMKVLTNSQIAKLTKVEKNAYFDELRWREKLFLKQEYYSNRKKEEEEEDDDDPDYSTTGDSNLPISFDSQSPTYLYDFPLDFFRNSSRRWLMMRGRAQPNCWDHDFGYSSLLIGRSFEVKDGTPVSFVGTVLKDKQCCKGSIEIATRVKHGKGKTTCFDFNMRTYKNNNFYATLLSDTRIINYRKNKTNFGASVTFLGGDDIAAGMKVENKLIVKKRLQLALCGAAVAGCGGAAGVAYGINFDATLRDKYLPAGCSPASLGISLVDNHGHLTAESNFKSEIKPIGWFTNLTSIVKLNNEGRGSFSICFRSSEYLQIPLIALFIPLLRKLLGCPQELQFGRQL